MNEAGFHLQDPRKIKQPKQDMSSACQSKSTVEQVTLESQ